MDEDTLFPTDLDLTDIADDELIDQIESADKWTYKYDYLNRKMLLTESGQPIRTTTYEEYLQEVALKILNTERFQYAVYDEEYGVERSEWSGWEDVEVTRDIEEALAAHNEIIQAEVIGLDRRPPKCFVSIKIEGLAGSIELMDEEVLTG
ncbi:DUF2634 domain-containing protein [Paenibacillus kandeliae]|uniref:DUF2634 domain-containing protein n=1 Tax=Paenibacillus kandeliae TaxID=3231269 RepID=UPI003457748A